jgi:hypothetical protein
MPRPRFTEDVEFRTGLDSRDRLVRNARFIRRPRVINGRTVPGNAAYYRRREAELRAERDALRRTLARMYMDPNAFATAKGWDCFERETE